MRRVQAVAAALVVALMVGGAAYAEREIGPDALAADAAGVAHSGGWFCPHGGGEEWEVTLQVANPGPETATIRVRTLGAQRPSPSELIMLPPGSLATVPVDAGARERTSVVEWFDQWVAAGWVAHAGGEEGGVAAEPCAPAAGDRWLLPDGTSEEEEQNDFLVIMNPFARAAVFSITLLSERPDPVQHSELTDVELKPFRSRTIRLDHWVDGERTVASLLEVSVGRVAAATLGVDERGGIRSALGYLGQPPQQLAFPGGDDAGRTDLVVMSTAEERVELAGDLLGVEVEQPFAGLADSAPPSQSGRTFPATTAGPTSVLLASDGPGIAAARRTFGVVADQAATPGAAPASAWLVLPAVSGSPSHPGLTLTNPGPEPAEVTLTLLAPASGSVTVTVPPRGTAVAPPAFAEAAPTAAILAIASSGTFVPASASYSRGRDGFATYAVALGIPIPEAWMPE